MPNNVRTLGLVSFGQIHLLVPKLITEKFLKKKPSLCTTTPLRLPGDAFRYGYSLGTDVVSWWTTSYRDFLTPLARTESFARQFHWLFPNMETTTAFPAEFCNVLKAICLHQQCHGRPQCPADTAGLPGSICSMAQLLAGCSRGRV